MDKKINVTSPLLPDFDSYVNQLKDIWDSKWLTNNGPKLTEFQSKLQQMMPGNEVELYSNGHLALDIAIKALDLKGEVITTPFTFASTTHAIVMNNLKPVFCDIKEDYCIDENKIEALITPNTSAILPVHVYGIPCNVKKIEEIAKKYHLKVIYDAAHAFNVSIDGTSIADFGDISMFSFHATKVFNTIEGGALVFSDHSLADKLRLLRNFGIENEDTVSMVGLNAKMNEFSASMGICNLEKLESSIQRRKEIVEIYKKNLSNIDGIKLLDYLEYEKRKIKLNYAYFPIIIEKNKLNIDRDTIYEQLKEKNIFTRKYFYPLIVDFDCYKDEFSNYDLQKSREISPNILTLPLSEYLLDDDIKYICKSIVYLLKGKNGR